MASEADVHHPHTTDDEFSLETTLDSISDAIWVVDADLRISYINDRGRWFHRSVIGRDVGVGDESVVTSSGRDDDLWVDRYRQALDGEKLCFLEQHDDGDDRYHFETCMEPIAQTRTGSGVVVVARPISQRRWTMLDTSVGATVIVDAETRILFANNGFERLVGGRKADLESGQSLLDFVHPDDKRALLEIMFDSHQPGREGRFERQLRFVDVGRRTHHTITVCGTSSDTHHTVISILDVTEQLEAQNRLRRQADQLRALHASAAELNALIREPLLLYRRTLELLREAVVYDTASVQLLQGDELTIVACAGFASADRVVGLVFPRDALYPNWQAVTDRQTLAIDDVGKSHPHFHRQADQFSSGRIHSWLGVPLTTRGEVVGMIALDRNTVNPFTPNEQRLVSTTANHVAVAVHNAMLYSVQQEYEAELREAGHQKEVLLRELHHRVKNNMQIVSSLLSLKLSALSDPEIGGVLEEMKIRIESLGAIHEELYQSERVDSVDLGEYTRRVVDLVRSSFGPRPGVEIQVETGEVAATVETSVPFGLILSELVLNALKHAFPSDRAGVIRVDLSSDADTVFLIVADNGVGLPDDMRDGRSGSLGMQLVESLGDQISGSVELEVTEGTRWTISFPAFDTDTAAN